MVLTSSRLFKSQPNAAAGFTLVEMMVAVGVFSLLMASFFSLTNATGWLILDSNGKFQINNDIRMFTSDLSRTGRGAAEFYIHRAFQLPEGGLSMTTAESDGGFGDVLILAFKSYSFGENDLWINNQNTHVSSLVIYARIPDANDNDKLGPVYRIDMSPAQSVSWSVHSFTPYHPVYSIFNDAFSAASAAIANKSSTFSTSIVKGQVREVIQLSRGRVNEKLFYRDGNHRFIVNGEIIHGQDPRRQRRVSNTYNFTVSPRG